MSKIYLALLDKNRLEVFQKLSRFCGVGYLAGGTALALQLNHRRSVDFDLFSPTELKSSLFRKCQRVFGRFLTKLRDSEDQLTFVTPEGINITFVYYPYKNVSTLIKTPYLNLASIQDIAADKAYTVGRRALWRDYVDIFFLLKKRKVSLAKIIQLAQKKFGGGFNENLFLEQLTYYDDIEVAKVDFLRESYTEKEIKSFLEEETRKYLKSVLT